MKNKPSIFEERRRHTRLPIMHGVLEPVDIAFSDPAKKIIAAPQPAILSDLSAGGMRLLTFLEPPHSRQLDIILQLPGLTAIPLKGTIAWVRAKGGVFMSGITFAKISSVNKRRINNMAEDYTDCDTRLALKLPEVCTDNCRCHSLCNKPQKDETLFKKLSRMRA
ncbi:MAG: PilZ domain-containing protein [bacterium]